MPGPQTVTMKGREAHQKRLKRMSGAEIVKAAGRVVYVGSDMIRAEAHVSINRVKHGRVVKGERRKVYTASAPGEAPAYDTENLRSGIVNAQTGPITAEVRSEDRKAALLEFGTSKMAARPYMRPARDAKAPEIQRLFEVEIDKLVKGSGT